MWYTGIDMLHIILTALAVCIVLWKIEDLRNK